MIIAKIGYCKCCGNENLRKISSEQVYCHNCGEYTRKDKLGYREIRNTEDVVYVGEGSLPNIDVDIKSTNKDKMLELLKELFNKKEKGVRNI